MKTKFMTLFLLTPFLLACNKNNKYDGPKMNIERDTSGQLTESTPEEMKVVVIDNQIDSVFFIGDEACSACGTAKTRLNSWIKEKQGKIYYIPLTTIDENNIQIVYDVTGGEEGYYSWEKTKTVPAIFFFKHGTAVYRDDGTNVIKYLNTYVDIQSE